MAEVNLCPGLPINGTNLPSVDYAITHLQSGRTFTMTPVGIPAADHANVTFESRQMISSGDYQVYIPGNTNPIKYPGTVAVKDYFSYLLKMTDPMPQLNTYGTGYAVNGKLYMPLIVNMAVLDLATGQIQVKPGEYYYSHQTVFFEKKDSYEGQKNNIFVIASFNEFYEGWDEMSSSGFSDSFCLGCFGVFNNHLIAVGDNGDIYEFDTTWKLKNKVDLDMTTGNYLYSANGNLYLFDFYGGWVTVVSGSTWNITGKIQMPHQYNNPLNYCFQFNGKLYMVAMNYENYGYDIFNFGDNEVFTPLDPPKIPYFDYTNFYPDGKGNVYLVTQGYVGSAEKNLNY